jgi:hypothetical protein
LRDQRQQFAAIIVDEEYGSPVNVNLFADNLQNDSRQLGKIDGGVQQLGCFEQSAEALRASIGFEL